MTQSLSCKQKSVLGLLLPLFQDIPQVETDRLVHEYQRWARRNLSPRTFGFKSVDDLLSKLDVFDRHDDQSISLSEAKLLDVLVRPLLSSKMSPSAITFERENGFQTTILLNYFKLGNLQQLLYKCTAADGDEAVQVTETPYSESPAPFVKQSFSSPVCQRLPLLPRPSLVPAPPPPFAHHMMPRHPPQLPISHSSSVNHYPNQGVFPGEASSFPVQSSLNRSPYQGTPPGHEIPLPAFSSVNRYPIQGVRPHKEVISLPPQLSSHSSVECHPNPGVPPGEEAFLPALTSVRPDMEVPILTTKPIFPSFSRRETKAQVLEKLEVYLQNYIRFLSTQRKHLPANIVVDIAKSASTKTNSLINSRQLILWKDIQCASNFSMLYGRTSEFIRCFCWNTSITSLYELQKAILILEKCDSFDDLQMGPILTHPLVKDYFKPPADLDSVPEITGYDLQKHLGKFISKYKRGEKYELSDFLEYFAKQLSMQGPLYLCVRITSFPLALKVSAIHISVYCLHVYTKIIVFRSILIL